MAKNNQSKIWIVIGTVTVIILALGGFLGYSYYQDNQANKIYVVNETVSFPDFDLKVTKTELKPVDLPIDEEVAKKYGGLDKPENCDVFSKESTLANFGSPELLPYGPSDYNICIRRNDSKNEIKKYSNENKQLVINYEIKALNNVSSSKLNVMLITDSGRKLDEQVNNFNANQFFNGGEQTKPGFLGSGYTSEIEQKYIPYFESEIGGDINKGLSRTGYAYTDVRNTEKSLDFKLTYLKDDKVNTRIVRIQL